MTITINLKGRLGNQLFQYAVLRNLSIVKGFNFYINTSLEWQGQHCLLNFFNIKNSEPPNEIKYSYCQPVNANYYDNNIFNINDQTLLDGHFENVEYFKENIDIIKSDLSIKDETINNFTNEYINKIAKDNSPIVGIQFRRGDVVQQVSDISQFNEEILKFVYESLDSIMKIEDKITLLVFTGGIRKKDYGSDWIKYSHEDDLLWVEQFKTTNASKYNIHISPGTLENNELIDYALLSKCDYLITPYQSTFSFMAYYMSNKVKKLFCPTNLYGGL